MCSKLSNSIVDEWYNDEYIAIDLHTAASTGLEERFRDLAEISEKGKLLNSKNKSNWTPLMYACYSGDHRIVSYLLEEGACANAKNSKNQTPLILAAKCGNTASAGLLIEHGATVDDTDSENWTALFYASAFGHCGVVQLLVERGACVNLSDSNKGMTPLIIAAAAGHEAIVKDLLQYGANVSMCSKSGITAKSAAVQNGHTKVKNAIDAHLFLRQNYFPCSLQNSFKPSNLYDLLEHLNLAKYYPIFESHHIDLNILWTLSDQDLKEIGIELLGPRKKLTTVIAKWHQNKNEACLDDQVIENALLRKSQELQQEIMELKLLLSQERSLRLTAEQRLVEGIRTFKFFSESIQRSAVHSKPLLETLGDAVSNLEKMLFNWTSTRENANIPDAHADFSTAINLVHFILNVINEVQKQNNIMLQSFSAKS